MSLTPEQKKRFRTLGHQLNPIVMVAGNGLTENIQLETDRALEDHELIKVRFSVGDRVLKRQLIAELCEIVEAELVQEIGNIALIYRKSKKPDPTLSNLLRWKA
ncbi:YhbY family RNA-binding protein [Nitrincola tapanii]|uniref:YhbY family RNA-binding protein n=1 Tax=Nitrincola tapanii TaxID=1708751 RepID=A0A5A9VZ59_9GAMM|nr:YhbY family RNA-binding protein [Nitrincola tapanii]KAA0873683.1 YhbY family RNA-binding protein [Nitrincola tapanii]